METKSSNISVYFSVIPYAKAGFSDQLLQFSAFYKLGLSLEYKYIHLPFSCERSQSIKLSIFEKIIRKVTKKIPHLKKSILSIPYFKNVFFESLFDIYEFLGFHQYFDSVNPHIEIQRLNVINMDLSDQLLEQNNISCFQELLTFIKNSIENELTSCTSDLLVQFRLVGGRKNLFSLINLNTPNLQELLNLRDIYFKKQEDFKCKSRFPNDKIKVLIHIRQGDTSVIKTPWQTYIPVRSINRVDPNYFDEYSDVSDIKSNETVFQVIDYYNFLMGLLSSLDNNSYSILTCSDGYQRAFEILEWNLDKLRLNADKIRNLKRSKKSYDKKCFDIFYKLSNSKCLVGESSKNLCDLIHSTLMADLVITSSQQRMLPKFITNYCSDSKPIVVILYKDSKPNNKDIIPRDEERFIYSDLYNPNYDYIVDRLMKLKNGYQ